MWARLKSEAFSCLTGSLYTTMSLRAAQHCLQSRSLGFAKLRLLPKQTGNGYLFCPDSEQVLPVRESFRFVCSDYVSQTMCDKYVLCGSLQRQVYITAFNHCDKWDGILAQCTSCMGDEHADCCSKLVVHLRIMASRQALPKTHLLLTSCGTT